MKTQTEKTYRERILDVLVHLQQHLDEDPGIEELARVACFSPYHFHRIFRGMVGEGVRQHVRRLRLERAALALKLGDEPITRLALRAGYESHEAFTRAFRRLFDMSPSEFRDDKKSGIPDSPSGVHESGAGGTGGFTPIDGDGLSVRVDDVPPRRVAFIRHVGPYDEVGPTWEKLMGWAAENRVFGMSTLMLGVCHDDPDVTRPERLRYDACVTVGPDVEGEGDVGIQEVGGGRYACMTHVGPYETLGEAWSGLFGRWLPTSGHALRSDEPCFEVYLNSPQDTPPDRLMTRIHVPVA